jgi:hypothetical protein
MGIEIIGQCFKQAVTNCVYVNPPESFYQFPIVELSSELFKRLHGSPLDFVVVTLLHKQHCLIQLIIRKTPCYLDWPLYTMVPRSKRWYRIYSRHKIEYVQQNGMTN